MIWLLLACVHPGPGRVLTPEQALPSSGRLEGFLDLYVDPEAFAARVRPDEPAPPAESLEERFRRADLPVENLASAAVVVSVNGTEVGRLGPLARGWVREVPQGSYVLGFRVPSGYVRTASVHTTAP